MHFIPFPPELAQRSADAAKTQYEARKGQRAGTHKSEGVACYRDANGKLRMAHDPYDPKYPEGATPGLGTVHAQLRHYPNDTSGYDHSVIAFQAEDELLQDAAPWANLCCAVHTGITGEPGSREGRFLIAPSEASLADMIPEKRSLCIRPSVIVVGMEYGEPPQSVVYMTPGMREMAIAGEPRAISELLVGKYDVEMPAVDDPEMQDQLEVDPRMSIDELCLSEICRRLNDRYSFTFDMARPGEMHVSNLMDFEMPEV